VNPTIAVVSAAIGPATAHAADGHIWIRADSDTGGLSLRLDPDEAASLRDTLTAALTSHQEQT